MLLTFANRLEMITTLSKGPVASIVELGVYKGEFAEFCSQTLNPKKHVLIDFWDYDAYEFVLPGAPQNAERERIFHAYFDKDPRQALSKAYLQVRKAFAHTPGVEIIKADIANAAGQFPDGLFEIIYLDGNHTYEFVLRDLYTWLPKLAPGGLFVCNDFFESPWASQQNIGVIPAFQSFSKRVKVHPIALSMSEWSDFYFSNREESPLIERLCDGLVATGHNNLEVPTEMLAAYHHRLVDKPSGRYLLPSFHL